MTNRKRKASAKVTDLRDLETNPNADLASVLNGLELSDSLGDEILREVDITDSLLESASQVISDDSGNSALSSSLYFQRNREMNVWQRVIQELKCKLHSNDKSVRAG